MAVAVCYRLAEPAILVRLSSPDSYAQSVDFRWFSNTFDAPQNHAMQRTSR
jgi:hypothetical protein